MQDTKEIIMMFSSITSNIKKIFELTKDEEVNLERESQNLLKTRNNFDKKFYLLIKCDGKGGYNFYDLRKLKDKIKEAKKMLENEEITQKDFDELKRDYIDNEKSRE